jgi:hypothetical protein
MSRMEHNTERSFKTSSGSSHGRVSPLDERRRRASPVGFDKPARSKQTSSNWRIQNSAPAFRANDGHNARRVLGRNRGGSKRHCGNAESIFRQGPGQYLAVLGGWPRPRARWTGCATAAEGNNGLQRKWSSPCKAHPATAPAGSNRRPTATEQSGRRSNWRAKGRSNKSVARDARSDPERCRSHDRARQARAFDKVRWLNIRSTNRLDHLELKYCRGSRFGMNPDQKSQ